MSEVAATRSHPSINAACPVSAEAAVPVPTRGGGEAPTPAGDGWFPDRDRMDAGDVLRTPPPDIWLVVGSCEVELEHDVTSSERRDLLTNTIRPETGRTWWPPATDAASPVGPASTASADGQMANRLHVRATRNRGPKGV